MADPYPVYELLLKHEPVSWIECLNMWWITGYRDVCDILMDQDNYVTESARSPISATFGPQMLSVEGADHRRYKNAARPPLLAADVRRTLEAQIAAHADALLNAIVPLGTADLRSAFASRLPVKTMLALFGAPQSDEPLLRSCYDAFEAALSDFAGDDAVRCGATRRMAEFDTWLQERVDREHVQPSDSLLGHLTRAGLSDVEVKRNASIILFGGVSTVEALILNTIWALALHPDSLARVRKDLSALPSAVEETMRWQSPVQSATRYAAADQDFHGHRFIGGELVNCMLGAANRDPSVFADPNRFDIDRAGGARHLGFAIGPHVCVGLHLARAEVRIAITALHRGLPALSLCDAEAAKPWGYEFRKPRTLHARWDSGAG